MNLYDRHQKLKQEEKAIRDILAEVEENVHQGFLIESNYRIHSIKIKPKGLKVSFAYLDEGDFRKITRKDKEVRYRPFYIPYRVIEMDDYGALQHIRECSKKRVSKNMEK